MKVPDITVVGSVNLDLVIHCEALPEPGQTVMGEAFSRHPGGKGANQALAACRLGANVALLARVGEDEAAGVALSLLRRDGVDLEGCRVTEDSATGLAFIAVASDGDNQIVVAPGANALLSPTDLPVAVSGALIGQLETPLAVLESAVARCSGLVVLNLAPAHPVPDELLRRANVLIVNEGEGAFYGMDRLLQTGGLVALTMGAQGAILFNEGREVSRAKPPHVTALDATGAGDTFVAALTVALLEHRSPAESLSFACHAAALSTTVIGAQPSLPYRTSLM